MKCSQRISVSLLTLVAALSACTTVAPQANDVRVTRETADVASCHPVGSVRSVPPYILPGDDFKQLRNQSISLGADTILVTSPRLVMTSGVAYRCKS